MYTKVLGTAYQYFVQTRCTIEWYEDIGAGVGGRSADISFGVSSSLSLLVNFW